ncbi:MAG: pyridoxal-phosphate dependent enzyme [Bifidobacteriaceae bacterium]|jgi:threonine synthase|nr:pyridoxal-phosphate dependent enzyme [Bifidobacteriaceae bacterium]
MHPIALRCIRCGTEYPPNDAFGGCERCESLGKPTNLQVIYPEDELIAAARRIGRATRQPTDMWHYRDLLPVDPDNVTTLGEGGTPLLAVPRLGAAIGVPRLYVKDESRNPTGSFKDRLGAAAVSAARQLGRQAVVGSSSGNAGAALAALAARAGMPCVMFTTQDFPLAMKTQMGVYGTYLLAAPTIRDRWNLMEAGVRRYGWFPVTVYRYPFFGSNAYGIEGYKTIGYEIVDQLDGPPDAIVFPVGAGDAFSGTYKALTEYARAGVIDRVPTMHAAEVFGPLEQALATGSDVVQEADTHGVTTVAISVGSTMSTYQALDVLQRTGGAARSASNAEMLAAQRDLAALEGIWVETSSALAVAALPKLVRAGALDPEGVVVAVLTSTGLKDPETTAANLPPIPSVGADFETAAQTLQEIYRFDPANQNPTHTDPTNRNPGTLRSTT